MSAARLNSQRGFTMVETLVAIFILASALLGAAKVFASSNHANVATQRRAVATHQAVEELEKLRSYSYPALALKSTAQATGDVDHKLGFYDTVLRVGTGVGPYCYQGQVFCGYEKLLVDASAGEVDPGPEAFTVDSSGLGTVTGKIYRYVTARNDCPPSPACAARADTKRITVAVTIDKTGNGQSSPNKPVWLSSTVTSATSGSAGAAAAGGAYNATTTTHFLYDTPCNSAAQIQTTANHATRNTGSFVNAANTAPGAQGFWSLCINGPNGNAADLMGTAFPSGSAAPSTPLYAYSSNISASPGLVMQRGAAPTPAACTSASPPTTTYGSLNSFPATPPANTTNGWNVHRWEAPITIARTIGRSTVRLFSSLNGSGVGTSGTICVTLLKRDETTSNSPSLTPPYATDTILASTKVSRDPWSPGPGKWKGFTAHMIRDQNGNGKPDAQTITPSTAPNTSTKLVLAITMSGASQDDLRFAYGHPIYPASLTIDNCDGGQCG